jgi:predicted HTH transcriptional regulator
MLKRMTEERFAQLLALGHETPGVEFKGPGSRKSKDMLALVARAILGMANRRDGGMVIIGIAEDNGTLTQDGISNDDLKTWAHEEVAGALAGYSDPYVDLHTENFEYKGKVFVVIEVDEFEEIPVLCKKDFPGKLRAGACYVRRRGRVETSEIPTQAEMRELLELASEKRLRSFLRQARGAGLAVQVAPSDSDLFDVELGEF